MGEISCSETMTSIIADKIKQEWNSRGYSFGIFRDHPGQVWADFVHSTDELVVLAEGEIEVEIEGNVQRPQTGRRSSFLQMQYIPSVTWKGPITFGIMDTKYKSVLGRTFKQIWRF